MKVAKTVTTDMESIYRDSMAISEVGVIVLDPNGRRLMVDDTAARILGKPKEEELQELFGNDLVPEDREKAMALFRRCLETGEATASGPYRWEVNGRTRYKAGHLVPIRDEKGAIFQLLSTISDITDSFEAAQEAKRLGELYRSLTEAVGGGVIRLDWTGRRTFVSDGIENLKGRPRTELLAGMLGDDMPSEDRDMAYQLLSQVFRTGEPVHGVVTRQLTGGEMKHVLANWVPVFGEDGIVIEVQTTSVDITEQVTMREQLSLYAGRVRRAQEEERASISRVLHDDTIQALMAVGHRIDVLMARYRRLPKEVVSELELAAETVWDQADALRRLCMGLRPAMLDKMGLAAAIEWLVRNACQNTQIKGIVRVDEDVPRVHPTAEIRLFRIAQEAVNNAVRHAKPNKVEVYLTVNDGHLELEVTDDGVGFEYSESQMRLVTSGKLGLAGIHERAKALGAQLRIQSLPGSGTCVHMRCPVCKMMDVT